METDDFLMSFAYFFMGGPPCRLYGKCVEFDYCSYLFPFNNSKPYDVMRKATLSSSKP